MSKKTNAIPVNHFGGELNIGFFIEKFSFNDLPNIEEWQQPERHDRHSFFILEKGIVTMEIDFQKYKIKAPSVIYMHPNQVHRIISFSNVTVNSLGIDNENLESEYLKLLEDVTPAKPLPLESEAFSDILDAVTLGLKLTARKNGKLRLALVKGSCNLIVALVLALYLEHSQSADKRSRSEMITRSFVQLLSDHFKTSKTPSVYAQLLNISTTYLNECVKKVSGHPVYYHIQQRIVLEAKRLLYHSEKSVKEIATELGYDDYSYFSRLFTRIVGYTPLAFRNRNRD